MYIELLTSQVSGGRSSGGGRGRGGIMIIICAHVPMSLRARTSVPDDRSEIADVEKVWFRQF